MIDKKKIEEAANRLCDHGSIYDSENRIKGFKKGAHWAIQELLKGLWHDAKEESRGDKPILLRYGYCMDRYSIYFRDSNYSWNKIYSLYGNFEWCYLDDLLPKQKGGEQ